MAFTSTLVKNNVMGNQRVCEYNVTADALSGAVATSLGFVESVSIAPISMATAGITIKINQNAAASTSNGSVHLSGCTNGDNFFLMVYGR